MSLEGRGYHPASSDNNGFQQKWYEWWGQFFEERECEGEKMREELLMSE